jgi:hypothetical protein
MDVELAMTAWTNNEARLGYFEQALRSLATFLSPTEGIIWAPHATVCSEELSQEFRHRFERIAGRYGMTSHYHAAPAEIGANHNFLLSKLTAAYTMFIEDDFVLERPLDLSDDIKFLEENPDFVMVRYFIGQPSSVDIIGELGSGLVEVGKLSSYPYSNTPHLRHRERFATLGPFAENVGWGCQEHAMGDNLRDSPLRIAVRRPDYFSHAGHFASQSERWPKGETP